MRFFLLKNQLKMFFNFQFCGFESLAILFKNLAIFFQIKINNFSKKRFVTVVQKLGPQKKVGAHVAL